MEKTLLRGYSILVVEDNSINQFLVKYAAEKFGAEVDFAFTGVEAIEKFQNKQYSVVLMDIQLPEMDGYETTTFIRNQIKSDVPIIAMTAFALNGENERCLQHGMNGYLSKPFSPEDLYSAITGVLTSSKVVTANPYILYNEDVDVDISMLYEVAGNDPIYINAMVSTFLDTIPVTLQKMEDSLATEDYESLYKLAHYSKSSLSIIKISNTYSLAQSIEQSAKSKSGVEEIPFMLQNLKNKVLLGQKALVEKFGESVVA